MLKFRKKSVVIEAFQMTVARRSDNADWPQWLHEAWNKEYSEVGAVFPKDYPESSGEDQLVIQTLEGALTVGWDDYIIQGISGELYACKPEIFKATYDGVS